ncbi:MAG: sigma 54-interacting transcriptional regulator [Myxococcales bacterium]|nr:sigma 54-interacting transcriptional regulator [Myxococcales bacterium]
MDRSTAHAQREEMAAPPLSLVWNNGAVELSDAINIGANPANHVALEDRFVSGFHCRVFPATGRWRVKDLGSTNGTFVDGLRVSEAELDAGARLRIGTHELRIEDVTPRKMPSLPGVVTRDPALAPVLELLKRAAPSVLPVMILGESGTGKEVAARAVHELSARGAGPFVPLNCGAISRELAEAELFGHEKGSFTGAITSAPGAFGAADGGTLFLDEIGDLPLQLQVKLLRALEAGEVKPVGAPRPRAIDVRVVCATHQDLRVKLGDGSFREDLFYRLRGVTVELPPLRARPQDILPLAEHFLPPRCMLAADARAALLSHRWPGNVRELRHVIQLGALLSDSPVLRAGVLHFEGQPTYSPIVADREIVDTAIELRGRTLGELEELAIRGALRRHDGNRHAVAAELGIARSTLLRKLDQLGLRSPD